MHSYDKRYNYVEGMCSRYTNDPAEVVRSILAGSNVKYVAEGHADREYVDSTSTQIGGEIITRRTIRSWSSSEFLQECGVEIAS